jgi:preprotein translocase subunit SecD
MKKRIFTLVMTLICCYSVAETSSVIVVPEKSKLQSGWYMVTGDQSSNSIKLEKSKQVFKIEKEIFISVKSIINVDLSTAWYNNKNNPILNFTLDKDASAKLGRVSSDFGNVKQIALIIKDKLIQVATIQGGFTGNKMSLAGKFTKEELLNLKNQIEAEKK